ncbi:MAG TPA: hypothetical protein VIL97_11480, partial [Thermoanaerobaculia bacterium]
RNAGRTRGATRGGSREQLFPFGLGEGGNVISLRRGIFFMADPAYVASQPPDWTRYAFGVAPEHTGGRALFRQGSSSIVPPDFDYFIVALEYGPEPKGLT